MVFFFVIIFRKENDKQTDDEKDEPINKNYKANDSNNFNQEDDCLFNFNLESENEKKELKKKKERKLFIKRLCIHSFFLAILVIASVSIIDPNSFSYQKSLKRSLTPTSTEVEVLPF